MKIILGELEDKDLKIIKDTGTIQIPENITCIGSKVFAGCKDLISIKIPAGVDYIEDGAFYDCDNLERIQFMDDKQVDLLVQCGDKIFPKQKSIQVVSFPSQIYVKSSKTKTWAVVDYKGD